MEERAKLRDDDGGGNAKRYFWYKFDIDFPIEKYHFDACMERLRSLFDQLLVAFMNEKCTSNCIRPIPVLCGHGRPVDLFKLFWVVRKIGGHESVSENNLWGFVSEQCGLGIRVVPTIKLIHKKYLNEMDQWFRQLIVNSRNSEGENCGVIPKLDLLCRELVNLSWDEHREENVKFLKDRNGGISEFVENTNDFAASPKSVVRKAVAKRVVKNAVERVLKNETSGFSEGQVDDEDNGNITKSAKKLVEKVINKVLNCEGTISVRDQLLIRKQGNAVGGENLLQDKQKKPRMPYHYDTLDHQSPETIRCSKRVPTLPTFQVCPCCNSNAAQTKTTIHQEEIKVNIPKSPVKLVHIDVDELPKRSKKPKALDMPPIKNQVSVGPLFQAQVPECTGVISENDLKWLGTRMWPLKDSAKQSTPIIKSGPVGKGRQHSCKCRSLNSVECFRFHIAEERLKLKLELGSLFYRWRFDQMGEEVSLSWTEAEENKLINDMISWHDKSPNSFWDKAPTLFPFKTREKLVSYYFNVFVVHRRSYQNRVTPEDVDSDDDEKEWGSIGWYFGYKALYVPH